MTFNPHGYCLFWNPPLIALMVFSNLLIAGSYFGIPIALLMARRRMPILMPRWATYLFSAFILLCGISHILEIIVLWKPWYWIESGEKCLAASVSFFALGMITLALRTSKIPSEPAIMIVGGTPDHMKVPRGSPDDQWEHLKSFERKDL